jgi:hypothetical protein
VCVRVRVCVCVSTAKPSLPKSKERYFGGSWINPGEWEEWDSAFRGEGVRGRKKKKKEKKGQRTLSRFLSLTLSLAVFLLFSLTLSLSVSHSFSNGGEKKRNRNRRWRKGDGTWKAENKQGLPRKSPRYRSWLALPTPKVHLGRRPKVFS